MPITITDYPDPQAHVVEPVGRVSWMNTSHDVVRVEIDRRLGTGLPEQVAGVNGFLAATATVEMSTAGLVSEGLHLPWKAGRPKRGDLMDVFTGLGEAERRVIRGRVKEVHGSITDPTIEVVLVDRTDQLNRPMTIDPLNFRMPPFWDGGTFREIGLHPTYLTDRIARACRFYATPPLHADSIMSAPLAGSAWPERGELVAAQGFPTVVNRPSQRSAPWGLATTNIDARYEPDLSRTSGRLDKPAYFHFLTAPPFVGSEAQIRMEWPSGDHLMIRFDATTETRQQIWVEHRDAAFTSLSGVSVFLDGTGIGAEGAEVEIWVSPPGAPGEASPVYLAVNGVQQTDQFNSLWMPEEFLTTPVEYVRVVSDSLDKMRMGGVQVGFAPTRRPLNGWTRTALYETDHNDIWSGVPGIAGRTGLDLLREQTDKSLAALWIDSEARLRYRSMERLLYGPITGEDITVDNIEDLSWSEGGGAIHESVRFTWKQPTASRGIRQTIQVFEAGSIQIAPGGTYENLFHPETDVDWIDVAPLVKLPNNNTNPQEAELWARWMAGIGSWVSAVTENDDGEVEHVDVGLYSFSFVKIDPRTYRVRVTASSSIGQDKVLSLRSAGHGYLPEHRRSQQTPLGRGRTRVQWDVHDTLGAARGPANTGQYEFDADFWIQYDVTAQARADYLASRISTPGIVYHDVPVNPDDRRELADAHRLILEGHHRKVLCVGIKDRLTARERTQTLTLQDIEELEAA